MGKLIVVVGGQYGSEGKGAVVAHLARTETERAVFNVRVGGPNAGHTVYDDAGERWPLRQVPAGVVAGAWLGLAAGSVIDPQVLASEVRGLEFAGHVVSKRLYVSSQATLLQPRHLTAEQELVSRIGSTGKGVGAARAERVLRRAETAGEAGGRAVAGTIAVDPDIDGMAEHFLESGDTVIVEGTQGYGLGLHAGHYPYCTSADCRAIDILGQAGISPWSAAVSEFEVWVVLRTYPIRVAGDSGPMAEELSWEALASRTSGYIQPERTTVTQKIRRVAEWDLPLARRAVAANGGRGSEMKGMKPVVRVALTMYDYWYPEIAGQTQLEQRRLWRVAHLEQALGVPVQLIGTGPRSIVDRRQTQGRDDNEGHPYGRLSGKNSEGI